MHTTVCGPKGVHPAWEGCLIGCGALAGDHRVRKRRCYALRRVGSLSRLGLALGLALGLGLGALRRVGSLSLSSSLGTPSEKRLKLKSSSPHGAGHAMLVARAHQSLRCGTGALIRMRLSGRKCFADLFEADNHGIFVIRMVYRVDGHGAILAVVERALHGLQYLY